MQPVDATSGARSLTTVRVATPSNQTARTDSVVEQIPIVEPRPHYPISASVAEIMAHITELIKEQQTASEEAFHQKNLDEARAEMEKLFEAVQGRSDNTVDGKADNNNGLDPHEKVNGINNETLKVSDNITDKSTLSDSSSDAENADGVDGRSSVSVNSDNITKTSLKTATKTNSDLPPLPSDGKDTGKKVNAAKAVKTHHETSSIKTEKGATMPAGDANIGSRENIQRDTNVLAANNEKEDI
ncbi:hypothetical protein BBC0178_005550 [Bartonella apihabitans]|uniref:Uncharacterized protein n=1 Tax=Bartonella apihabitans TaxID=2750929 RepID=A0A1U9M9Q1_9HYPH|nr:hypothetical protein [Bartonella apihabitans]AQT42053.1 hypothetical protein BBC0178_005550 [Bartonella apihabitans]